MVMFEHGVNACGSIAAVMVKLGVWGRGLGGCGCREQLGRQESAHQRSALLGGPVPDNGL